MMPPMRLDLPDAAFLEHLDWSHPSLRRAGRLRRQGKTHAAALAAARAIFGRPFRHPVREAEIPALARIINRHYPAQVADLRRRADRYILRRAPAGVVCGRNPEDEWVRFGGPLSEDLTRGNAPHLLGRLYHLTGERKYAAAARRVIRRIADDIRELPDGWDAGAFVWHPKSKVHQHSHDLIAQNLCHALPYLRPILPVADALALLKMLLALAEFNFRTCKHEVMFNIPLHMLTSCHLAALCLPQFKHSRTWAAWIGKRLLADCTGRPFATPDGYCGEGFGYQCVNHNLLLNNYRYMVAAGKRVPPPLRRMCEKTFEFACAITRNDGKYPLFGDAQPFYAHEHYIHTHEMLHLAAAVFRRPEFKAAAGGPGSPDPMEYNVWMMGVDGWRWWHGVPSQPAAARRARPHDFRRSGFQFFGLGAGTAAHSGMLACAATHNHAHRDFGSIDISGLGRPLLTDGGAQSYSMDDYRSDRAHNTSVLVRREPLGPRIDNPDHVLTHFVVHTPTHQAAAMSHDLYENHRIRRTLCLFDAGRILNLPPPAAGADHPAFWLVLDRIERVNPWPRGATVPHDFIESFFHFSGPEGRLGSDPDTLTCWSRHAAGVRTIRRHPSDDAAGRVPPETVNFQEFLRATEHPDSDANLQVTAIIPAHRHYIMDMRFFESCTAEFRGRVKRPAVAYRFQGFLPFDAAYVLVPFRGVRNTPYARVTGRWHKARSLEFRVDLPQGAIRIHVRGGFAPGHAAPRFEIRGRG